MERQSAVTKKLRSLRKRLHMTQQVFAESVGYGQSYYATMESGLRSLSVPMMQKICKVYGLPATYFLDLEPPPGPADEAAAKLRAKIVRKLEACDTPLLRKLDQIIDILQ